MRFVRAKARAFGPLKDATIEVAPGMTLIHGPNESGKSSWQAALYAGLCGIRRARGQPRTADREFADRYRPWDGDDWSVTVVVALDDSRQVEIRQDLDGRIDCRATDALTGADLTSEILNEGTPDGAKWLGFDRDAFAATAFVRQAQIVNIIDDADTLQEDIQRAAASSAARETTARAIERIEGFRSEHVGTERSNSTKPLRRALDEQTRAESQLREATRQHAEHLELLEKADALGRDTRRARARFEHATARARAVRLAAELRRVRELAARLPDGQPTPLRDDDSLAREVASAVDGWRHVPAPPSLEGRSSDAIRSEIASLPAMPEGDLEPAAEVELADSAHRAALHAREVHEQDRPKPANPPETAGFEASTLRELAAELELSCPEVPPAMEARLASAMAALDAARSRARAARAVVAVSVAALIVGAGALLLDLRLPGTVVLALALAALVSALFASRRADPSVALEEVRAAEQALGERRFARRTAEDRRRDAIARVKGAGLAEDVESLRRLATALDAAAQRTEELVRWQERGGQRDLELSRARSRVEIALRAHGAEVPPGSDLGDQVERYRAACRARADLARRAGLREGLERQLESRHELERTAREAETRIADAQARLVAAASRCGLPAGLPEQVVEELSSWQLEREEQLAEHDRRQHDWATLQSLLAGRTLEDLQSESERAAREEADRWASLASLDPDAVNPAPVGAPLDEDSIEGMRREAERIQQEGVAARTRAEGLQQRMVSVVEAEEARESAKSETERVRSLERVLHLTQGFLERAQEEVHRDVARFLIEAIRPWLPTVTEGRYTDVRLDPASLDVTVLEASTGEWRRACALSHGTCEQIYLLVRAALAQHLPRASESCPLLLDDVTVQSDARRTIGILDLLHRLSETRQVILFTQEEDVLAWARTRLVGPRDRIVALAPPPVRSADPSRGDQ